MGLVVTKYFEGKIEYKRLRLNFNTTFKLRDSDGRNETSPFQHSVWENLPYVALVEIYRYLPDKDKFNMSLVCKAWGLGFSRPEVWRHVKFSFNGIEDWRALRFAETLASGLRHLEIDRQTTHDMFSQKPKTSVSTYTLYTFLDTLLKYKDCQLVTLRLINMKRMSQFFQRYAEFDLVKVLGDFLSTQTNLKVLDLTSAGFSSRQGINLLSQAASGSGSTINVLSMNEMFSNVDSSSLNTCLQSFTSLSELTISYQYLSDDLLDVLSVSGSLNHLNVFVPKLEIFGATPTSSEFWEKLKRSRPSLEAHYFIDTNMQFINDLKVILVPGIPLVSLEFGCNYTGTFWYVLTFHIAWNFKYYLRRLDVKINLEHNSVYGMLDKFFDNCHLLQEIHITDMKRIPGLQTNLTRFVRERLSKQTAIQLQKFTFDGVEVNLDRNCFRILVDWWHMNLRYLRFRWNRTRLLKWS